MPSDGVDVETLFRELSELRAAARSATLSDEDVVTIERAVDQATQSVFHTINAPLDQDRIGDARESIRRAAELVVALAAEIERARRASERAIQLGVKRPRPEGEPG